MEHLKPLSAVNTPDHRNLMFVRLDTFEPLTLEEHHQGAASIGLNSYVPDDIRSYFTTAQNVYLYAWFSYDLYAVVQLLCFTTIEMALRVRICGKVPDGRGLSALLKEALAKKMIKPKALSHIREMRHGAAERIRMDRKIIRRSGSWPKPSRNVRPPTVEAQVLARSIPWLRNAFAHPRIHTIAMPGEAFFQLQMTSELINQLFS